MNSYFNIKKNALKRTLISAAILGAALVGSSSYAATQTANMSVSATIAATCTISAGALAFGTYDPVTANASADLDATATLTTVCTTGSSPTITLDEGANPEATSTASAPLRQMISGANVLSYQLYSDSGRTAVWADTGVATPTASGTAETNTVYGRITAGQNKPTGSYTDTIVATVTF